MARSSDNTEELYRAVLNEDITKVRALILTKKVNPNHKSYWSKDWGRYPPLHTACWKGNLEIVKMLVNAGADINKGGGQYNKTPLHQACEGGSKEVVDYLIMEAGCKVDVTDNKNKTPIDVAAENANHTNPRWKKYIDIIDYLKCLQNMNTSEVESAQSQTFHNEPKKNPSSVITYRAESDEVNNKQEEIERSAVTTTRERESDVHVEQGPVVNLQSTLMSALLSASEEGHYEAVKVLIESGAEVNMQNNTGYSALMGASQHGHCDVVKLLIEKGADVNMQTKIGWSALMIASQNGYCDLVKMLIEKGAEVNMLDNAGKSALIIASRNGHPDVIKLLIEKLAAQAGSGLSAVTTEHEKDVVQQVVNSEGQSVSGKNKKAELIEEHSVGTSVDCSGETAIEWVSQERDNDVVKATNKGPVPSLLSVGGDSPSSEFGHPSLKRESSSSLTELMPSPKQRKEFSEKTTCPELTVDDLFEKHSLQRSLLDCEVQRDHLQRVSRLLEDWKEFARAAGLTEPEIVAVDRDEQNENGRRFKALHVWHKKNAFLATNRELIRIMLGIGGDVAQKVCVLLKGNGICLATGTQVQSTGTERVTDDLVLFKNNPIGRGAFGIVFRGEFNKQPCAIKVLRALADEIQLSYPVAQYTMKGSFTRFKDECKYLESFDHPNIVCHLATRTHPTTNHLVLALELMDCNLRQYFTPQPGKDPVKLSLTVQSSLCLDIASALEYIHSRGVVHRDLCSDNILLACGGENPVAKVCDFGMSRLLKSEAYSISFALGHKGYMPPEATDLESSRYNTQFDIFSFGALMVQIVRHLPTIKDKKERRYELNLIELSHPIKALMCECLCENRDDRPSASQLKRRLQLLLQFYTL